MTGPKITLTPSQETWVVRAGGAILAESSDAIELHEGEYRAVIYFPRKDIVMDFLDRADLQTTCPHKGIASYFSIAGKNNTIANAAWSYENPIDGVERIKNMLAFDLDKTTVEMV